MLLDMDNFGQLNRERGNLLANAVLLEVADIAAPPLNRSQIRLGGDEFMLFIRNYDKNRLPCSALYR